MNRSKFIFSSFLFTIFIWPCTEVNSQCAEDCLSEFSFFVGTGAGTFNVGSSNSFFGYFSGFNNGVGSSNSFFGYFSGASNKRIDYNSFFGHSSGLQNSTGSDNSFFGGSSGESNTTGNRNSFFGYGSGITNTSGANNSFFGTSSGVVNKDGSFNAYIGGSSGLSNVSGSFNTFIGFESGQTNTSGSKNTFIGYSAGKILNGASSRNIIIGSEAGPITSSLKSDRLYIDNSLSDIPLIYGDFEQDAVVINGTFEVATGFSNPSSKELKFDYTSLKEQKILAKIAAMDIQEWSYIPYSNQRHIGPIAEDFYNEFSLGKNNKSVSTIDASGVVLVAAKALYRQNVLLKEYQSEIYKRIDSLKSRINKLERESN